MKKLIGLFNDKDWLSKSYALYTIAEIAKQNSVSPWVIQNRLLSFGIPIRRRGGKKGQVAWNKGLHTTISKQQRIKISNALLGRKKSDAHKKKLSLARIGKYTGNKNPAWKGGKRKLKELIYGSYKYTDWRNKVFSRDNWTCLACGYKKGRILEAHHIVTIRSILDKENILTYELAMECKALWEVANGITLCSHCHARVARNEEKYATLFTSLVNSNGVNNKGFIWAQ